MIKSWIRKKLDKAERDLGESTDYMRYMLGISLPAFMKFAKIFPISAYRKRLPAKAFHVARIVAAREEDCGTCVQIEVNLARDARVPVEVLRAVVTHSPEQLPPDLALVYRFVEALVKQMSAELELRDQVKSEFGEEALVELALAIATSRFLPMVKRTLGYGTSCSKVELRLE